MSRHHGKSGSRDRDRERDRKDRRRSRSRDRDRRRDRRTPDEPIKKVIDLKAKMRESFAQADLQASQREQGTSSSITISVNQMSVKEEANSLARVRQIEEIESEQGFRPQQFKATLGGAGGHVYGDKKQQPSKAEKAMKKEDAHEASIFGPTKPQTLADIDLPKAPKEVDVGRLILHSSLSEDPEVRQQRWLKLWRQRRRELGIV